MQHWPAFFFDTALIEAIPRAGWLTPIMSLITDLGTESVFIPLLAILLWSGRYLLVFKLHTAFFFSYFINNALKAGLALPRPSMALLSPEIQTLALRHPELTGGLPSGHAQAAITFYLLLGLLTQNRWLKAIFISIAILMPVSRLYLGVHYPGDILVGLTLGSAIAAVAWYYGERYLRRHSQAPLVMNLLWLTPLAAIAGWYSEKEVFVAGGALLGYLIVAPALGKATDWQNSLIDYWGENPLKFALFTLVALAGVFLLRLLLKLLLPAWPMSDMIRYFLLLLAAGYLIPLWQKKIWRT